MDPQTPSALQQPKPAHTKPAEQGNALPPRRRRGWVWLLFLILLGAAVYFLWPRISGLQTARAPSETKATRQSGTGPAITPVIAARAQKGNIGVYYTGLGAVTPIYTVTVKS